MRLTASFRTRAIACLAILTGCASSMALISVDVEGQAFRYRYAAINKSENFEARYRFRPAAISEGQMRENMRLRRQANRRLMTRVCGDKRSAQSTGEMAGLFFFRCRGGAQK